jgi:serine/threonine protein kinase
MYFLVEDQSQSLRNFYIVGEKIGQGTFGTVRLVSRRDTGEEFAVKTIDKHNLDQDELNSLSLEIDIISQVDHPNIVKTLEVYDEQDSINIVMECMTGGELFDRVGSR